jgi:hypothetical protein
MLAPSQPTGAAKRGMTSPNDTSAAPLEAHAGAVDARAQAALDVLAERRRQVEKEGWTPERDDAYKDYSLARAAAAYALAAATDRADRAVMDDFGHAGLTGELMRVWPQSWAATWFKPKSRRNDLVKAGALVLAEIERLDRAASQQAPAPTTDEDARDKKIIGHNGYGGPITADCSCPSGDGSLRWPCKQHPPAPTTDEKGDA